MFDEFFHLEVSTFLGYLDHTSLHPKYQPKVRMNRVNIIIIYKKKRVQNNFEHKETWLVEQIQRIFLHLLFLKELIKCSLLCRPSFVGWRGGRSLLIHQYPYKFHNNMIPILFKRNLIILK
jgi:hypothetical protein